MKPLRIACLCGACLCQKGGQARRLAEYELPNGPTLTLVLALALGTPAAPLAAWATLVARSSP